MEKQEHYTSASMFPQVVKHMMTAITNHDLSDQELGQIGEMCRDLKGMADAERQRLRGKQNENQGMEI